MVTNSKGNEKVKWLSVHTSVKYQVFVMSEMRPCLLLKLLST